MIRQTIARATTTAALFLLGACSSEGDRPVGVSTYGLGTDWSFWYAPAFAP